MQPKVAHRPAMGSGAARSGGAGAVVLPHPQAAPAPDTPLIIQPLQNRPDPGLAS